MGQKYNKQILIFFIMYSIVNGEEILEENAKLKEEPE